MDYIIISDKNRKEELLFRCIGLDEIEQIKELFLNVFTAEPWNDDWSDVKQLDLYLKDLVGQNSSLAFGLFEDGCLIGLSMGCIRHWYTGTEYYIDELCIRKDLQGRGLGARFLHKIEDSIRDMGLSQIFLQTEASVPAYDFYRKNGYQELKGHVSFAKKIS